MQTHNNDVSHLWSIALVHINTRFTGFSIHMIDLTLSQQ